MCIAMMIIIENGYRHNGIKLWTLLFDFLPHFKKDVNPKFFSFGKYLGKLGFLALVKQCFYEKKNF